MGSEMCIRDSTKVVCIWMTVAVILALLVFYIAAGKGKKSND